MIFLIENSPENCLPKINLRQNGRSFFFAKKLFLKLIFNLSIKISFKYNVLFSVYDQSGAKTILELYEVKVGLVVG